MVEPETIGMPNFATFAKSFEPGLVPMVYNGNPESEDRKPRSGPISSQTCGGLCVSIRHAWTDYCAIYKKTFINQNESSVTGLSVARIFVI